jgi:hypothetical protein
LTASKIVKHVPPLIAGDLDRVSTYSSTIVVRCSEEKRMRRRPLLTTGLAAGAVGLSTVVFMVVSEADLAFGYILVFGGGAAFVVGVAVLLVLWLVDLFTPPAED